MSDENLNDEIKIKLGLDTEDAEQEIGGLDEALDRSLKNMNRFFEEFQKNLFTFISTFGQAQNEAVGDLQETLINKQIQLIEFKISREEELAKKRKEKQEDDKINFKNLSEKERLELIEAERKSEEREKALTFEKQLADEEKQRLERQQRFVAGLRDMGSAILGIAAAGADLKKALDFSDNLTRTGLHLKAMGMNPIDYFETRNVLRKKGIQDSEYNGAIAQQNGIFNTLTTAGVGALSPEQHAALNLISQHNPALMDPLKSGMSFAQWSREVEKGAEEFKKDTRFNLLPSAKNDLIKSLFGNNIDLTEVISEGITNKEKQAEYAHAKKEADSFGQAGRVTAANQERRTINETNMAGLIDKAAGPAEKFFNALNSFLDRYGEMAIMAKLLGEVTLAIGGLGAMKLLKKGGGVLAGGLFRKVTGSVAGGAIKEAAIQGAKKGLIAMGGQVLLGGGRRVLTSKLGAVGIAYELTGGTMSTSAHDTINQQSNDPIQVRYRNRVSQIERALHATASVDDGKLVLIDRDGNRIFFTDSESIETIRARMRQKVEESKRSWWGSIFPSTHAAEPVQTAAAGYSKGRYSRNNLSVNHEKNAREMVDILMQEGNFTRNQAVGIVASKVGESGLNPQAVGDNGTSFGVAQWHTKERKEAFKRLFGHDIQQATLQEQTRFIIWEMNNTHKQAGDAIRQAKTAKEATAADVALYERPQDPQGEIMKRQRFIDNVENAIDRPPARGDGVSVAQNPLVKPNGMDAAQLQWQNRASQIHNETHNSTVNNHGAPVNQTMTNNIHIDARGGNLEQLRKNMEKSIRFPDASTMNGITGVG